MRIFVVHGVDRYGDNHWFVRAFRDEAAARTFVAALDAGEPDPFLKAKGWKMDDPNYEWEEVELVEDA